MKLVPLFDKVVLKQLAAEETTKSGIVLPGQAKENPSRRKSSQWDPAVWWTEKRSPCR